MQLGLYVFLSMLIAQLIIRQS
eukprot:SAG25_NODE_5898_length_608_cov_0.836935_1_plen_21_part_10